MYKGPYTRHRTIKSNTKVSADSENPDVRQEQTKCKLEEDERIEPSVVKKQVVEKIPTNKGFLRKTKVPLATRTCELQNNNENTRNEDNLGQKSYDIEDASNKQMLGDKQEAKPQQKQQEVPHNQFCFYPRDILEYLLPIQSQYNQAYLPNLLMTRAQQMALQLQYSYLTQRMLGAYTLTKTMI